MKSPLDGIKILDLTIWQNGPWGTVMLSDMGAEVIKIEDTVNGDPGRNSNQGGPVTPIRSYFQTMNRNKRGMTLNLKSQEGRDIFYTMVKQSDVVTQNFRVGVVERLGVDYETVKKHNPMIVYASNSGLGPKGPDAQEAVMDILGQARGGLMYHSSFSHEEVTYHLPGGLADQMGAVMMAYGVLLGIIARDRHGVGQLIEVSQLGSQMVLQALAINNYLINGVLSRPQGRPRTQMPNPIWNTYRCGDDRWLALGCNQADRFWSEVCRVLEMEDLIDDPKSCEMQVRAENAPEITERMDKIFASKPRAEWLKRLQERRINCAPVQDYGELVEDPQVAENEYISEVEHATYGTMREVGVPVKLSETPGRPRSAAPEFGEHTEQVLLDHGYSWDQIAAYRGQGVI